MRPAQTSRLIDPRSSVRPIVEGVLAGFVVIAAGSLLSLVGRSAPTKRLWRLKNTRTGRALTVVISQRAPEPTRTYQRPVTGIGQVDAVWAIAHSLSRGYRAYRSEPPRLVAASSELPPGDFITVGGQSANSVTRTLLDRLQPVFEKNGFEVRQRSGDPRRGGDRIFVRMGDGPWVSFGGMPVGETLQDVETDYGLIVRAPSPNSFREPGTCLLFAGVHTFGTGGAASYFVRQWWKPSWWTRRGMVALIKFHVSGGVIVRAEPLFRRHLRL